MRNLVLLAKLVDLNRIEQQVLAFMVWMQASRELREVAGEVLCCNNAQVVGLLASTLAVDQGELKMALDRSGALVDSGLLTIMDGLAHLSEKVMLRDGLEDVLLDERATEKSLVGSFFDRVGEGDLKAIDFQHLSDELRLIADYLRGAYSERLMGVNVLLYGPPGTGNTEFAKLLARTVGKSLYAVRNADVDGDPASAAQRLIKFVSSVPAFLNAQ